MRIVGDLEVYEEAVVRMTVFDHAPPDVQRAALEQGDIEGGALMEWWEERTDVQKDRILAEAIRRAGRLRLDLFITNY